MRKLLVLLPLFVACEFPFLQVESAYPEIDVSPSTIKEAWLLSADIVYESDPHNIWQFPETTYGRNRGDCEDISMLFAYFLENMGIDAEIIIYSEGKGNHAIVRAENKYYEPSAYGVYRPASKIGPKILQVISYEKGLTLCKE